MGLFSQGDLRIEDGASLTSSQGYVGANSGGNGNVTVTGAGSNWEMTSFNLNLGNYGTGVMTIDDGARVYANSGVYLGISDTTASGTLNVLGVPGARGVLETSGFRAGWARRTSRLMAALSAPSETIRIFQQLWRAAGHPGFRRRYH